MNKRIAVIICLIIGVTRFSYAQDGVFTMESTSLRATYFSNGENGQSGIDGSGMPYTFPGTSGDYIQLFGIRPVFGALVTAQDGSNTRIPLVMTNHLRVEDGGSIYDFSTVEGFVNPDYDGGIAHSSNPESWPAFWPHKTDDLEDPGWRGSWPGIIDKDWTTTEELFYRFSDREITPWLEDGRYVPIAGEPTRGGLGIEVDVQVATLRNVLFGDVHVVAYTIHNVSDYDLDEFVFGLQLFPWVGSPTGDITLFDAENEVLHVFDQPRSQTIGPIVPYPGTSGLKIIRTPRGSGEQVGISSWSLWEFRPYTPIDEFWTDIMNRNSVDALDQGSNQTSTYIGTPVFSLSQGASQRFIYAISASRTESESQPIVFNETWEIDREHPDIRALNQDFILAPELFNLTEEEKEGFLRRLIPDPDAKNPPEERSNENLVGFSLSQNFPNPFNPQTTISFSLPYEGRVKIDVFDQSGRHITTLIDQRLSQGFHRTEFDGSSLASGVYTYQIDFNGNRQVKLMTLIN